MASKTVIVRNNQNRPVATLNRLPGVASIVTNPNTKPTIPGPVTNLPFIEGDLDSFAVTLTPGAGTLTYVIGDGDNIYERVSGLTLNDPTSTGVSGVSGANLNASFKDRPVEVAEMNVEMSSAASSFSVLPNLVSAEYNGYNVAKPIPVNQARSSADYNPKIRVFRFEPGQLILSRNRGMTWAITNPESCNIVFKVRAYRD